MPSFAADYPILFSEGSTNGFEKALWHKITFLPNLFSLLEPLSPLWLQKEAWRTKLSPETWLPDSIREDKPHFHSWRFGNAISVMLQTYGEKKNLRCCRITVSQRRVEDNFTEASELQSFLFLLWSCSLLSGMISHKVTIIILFSSDIFTPVKSNT